MKLKGYDFDSSQGYWVLGDLFLQNYQAIFDMESMKVGLVGNFKDAQMPLEALDVLKYLVAALLLVTLLYIGCQMTIKDSDAIDDADMTE